MIKKRLAVLTMMAMTTIALATGCGKKEDNNKNILTTQENVSVTEGNSTEETQTETQPEALIEASADDFYYEFNEAGGITLTHYMGEATVVVIPTTIDGKKVTILRKGCFGNNDRITKVVCPEFLEEIGEQAFVNCYGLEEIVLNDGLKSVGAHAFLNCQLKEVIMPDSIVAIFEFAFGSAGIETVEISTGLTELSNGSLFKANITTIVVPNNIKTIGPVAFGSCANLQTVVIEEGCESIAQYAFGDCPNLTSVVIPASVTEIGNKIVDKSPNAVLTVQPGSYAEQYAIDNGIAYVNP